MGQLARTSRPGRDSSNAAIGKAAHGQQAPETGSAYEIQRPSREGEPSSVTCGPDTMFAALRDRRPTPRRPSELTGTGPQEDSIEGPDILLVFGRACRKNANPSVLDCKETEIMGFIRLYMATLLLGTAALQAQGTPIIFPVPQ